MSGYLWKYYLENDLDNFRQLLGEAATTTRANASKSNIIGHGFTFGVSVGSPGILSPSPVASHKLRNDPEGINGGGFSAASIHDVILGRADINSRDGRGLTILHLAASSTTSNACAFAFALIAHPLIDFYIQDLENGWTALHRAFYFGNIAIARAIVNKDAENAISYAAGGPNAHSASLMKIKDKEGNGPYDLLAATIQDRTFCSQDSERLRRSSDATTQDDDNEYNHNGKMTDNGEEVRRRSIVKPFVDVCGDALLTFGSNKNITLGFGDEDDRQHPERVTLKRPDHLFYRFHAEHIEKQVSMHAASNSQYAEMLRGMLRQSSDLSTLPSVVRSHPISIQDVQMSKLHTAVLTGDPESNLYICGHGLGGRLGTGSEKTRFQFVCVEDFGSVRRKIVAVALGQDHTLAVTSEGEIFAWGCNNFGQLGFGLSKTNLKPEDSVQLTPKQIFGLLKREVIVGVAASRIHSVAHTATSLYTFGKNEGQLGIVDAHARSLKLQDTPRSVAASRFACGIRSVSAIDAATICLLENHEVHVFANYGVVRVSFALETITNYFLKSSLTTKYGRVPNRICKIACGGNTICALASAGEVFTITVDQRLDPGSSSTTSTTNPNKIRAALSPPFKMWSLKKDHMAAQDVDVDQDGSIIISTAAGSVWRRVRRAKVPGPRRISTGDTKSKAYKFSRIPGLTRVVAVRSSGVGAYCAIRRDCDVTRSQIFIDPQSLSRDVFDLLPFRDFAPDENSDTENPTPIFWRRPDDVQRLCNHIMQSADIEKEMSYILDQRTIKTTLNYDAFIGTTVSDVKIPVHKFILGGRSRLMREALSFSYERRSYSHDFFFVDSAPNGKAVIIFRGVDFLTIIELVFYLYSDVYIGFWQHARRVPKLAFRYRQIRTELLKLSAQLELRNLEIAARQMINRPEPSLNTDLELAILDPRFFLDGDAVVHLSDGELLVHSDLLSRRCPFFRTLFQGRAGGRWLAQRRNMLADPSEAIGIDMKHVELGVFRLVLRHIYADTGEELFDNIVTQDIDEFLDFVMDVLSVANELMVDRLSQICQTVLGRHVTVRNACQLLNAVAPCSVSNFKASTLEYICLSLEAMLTTHLLNAIDEDLLIVLDQVIRDNQLAALPFAKSGESEALLHQRHPELASIIERARQAKIDAISLRIRLGEQNIPGTMSIDVCEDDRVSPTTTRLRTRPRHSDTPPDSATPVLRAKHSIVDLVFKIDDDDPRLSGTAHLASQFTMPDPVEVSEAFSIKTPTLSFVEERIDEHSTTAVALARENSPSSLPFAVLDTVLEPTGNAEETRAENEDILHSHLSPWGSTPLPWTKLDLKDIMGQTSSSRPSNISLGLLSQSTIQSRVCRPLNVRGSQKERRKQQPRQHIDVPDDSKVINEFSSPTHQSPWQSVSPKPKSRENHAGLEASTSIGAKPALHQGRLGPTPQLTMRQTVAKAPIAAEQIRPPTLPRTPGQRQWSVSTPRVPKPTLANNISSPVGASKPIPIQSIHHQPRIPADISPTFFMHQPLADILSQQQFEKNVIKEAAAKRDLQEIQQEQEFQEWWDQESRRVMEEEAAVKAASSRGRGRSGGRRARGQARGRGAPRQGKVGDAG